LRLRRRKYPAIGVNIGAYSTSELNMGQALETFLSEHGSDAVEVSACIPVMVTNPISCHVGGEAKVYGKYFDTLSVTSSDFICTTTATFALTADQGLMGSAFCPRDIVGQGTIVIGATAGLTHWLGSAMGLEVPHGPSDTFVVTCDVDTTEA
jgi:hypothetical protein